MPSFGTGDVLNVPELAQLAEKAGVWIDTAHGRARYQPYQRKADWCDIAPVKKTVSIPAIANGDVVKTQDSAEILKQLGADAVMAGRPHYCAPSTAGVTVTAAMNGVAAGMPQSMVKMADDSISHYEDMLDLYGIESGLRQARKHLGCYLNRNTSAMPNDL